MKTTLHKALSGLALAMVSLAASPVAAANGHMGAQSGAYAKITLVQDESRHIAASGGANHVMAEQERTFPRAHARATADVAFTQLRAVALSQYKAPTTGCGFFNTCPRSESTATAAMWDRIDLTFENPGRNEFGMKFKIDGVRTDTNSEALARWAFSYDPNFRLEYLNYTTLHDGEQEFSVRLVSPTQTATIYGYMELFTKAWNGGFADYGHTMTFEWDLPPGTTYTSASGVFGTGHAAVPEPATWAMMILGFGGAGVVIRRRARRPTFAA
jgi:hypothetical protein